MEVYQDPKPVLPCPLEGAKDVLPGRAGHEGFTVPHVNGPPGDGYPDPIQSSACDLREIFLSLCGKRG